MSSWFSGAFNATSIVNVKKEFHYAVVINYQDIYTIKNTNVKNRLYSFSCQYNLANDK